MKIKNKIIITLIINSLIIISCEKEVSKSNPVTPKPIGGVLKISSVPTGAKIYVDGKTTGLVTPDSITWLDVNKHKVTLKKEFYLDTSFVVDVKENVTKQYFIDFNASPNMWGSITCQTVPDKARIFLNGKDTGEYSPATIDSLIPGKYFVRFVKNNARDDSMLVTVKSRKNSLIWLVLTDTTYWVDYNKNTSAIPNYSYTKIAVDKNDNIWLGSIQNGITKFDGKNWTVFNTANSNIIDNNINELKTDHNGDLWICTSNGLSKFDNATWKNFSANQQNGIPDNVVNDIAFDIDGNPIVATSNGLAKYDGNKWNVFRFNLDFPSSFSDADKKDQNYYTGIDVDNNGSWWATRLRNGIAHWNGTNWEHFFVYYANDIPDHNIFYKMVRHSNNTIWFVHQIQEMNQATVALSTFSNGYFDKQTYGEFNNVNINSIEIKNGHEKWLSTSQGLYRFVYFSNKKLYTKTNTPLATNDIQDVAFDSHGNVWVVTVYNGIYKFKIGKK